MEMDARGLRCPLPIVKLTQAIKTLTPGAEIRVQADDLAFKADVEAWCRKTGNTLVSAEVRAGELTVVIRKEG